MNIHEYQAKELLQKFGVGTTRGRVASTLDQAEQIARELGDVEIVVKAQIHAGGRGKGTFTNGFKGGVHVRKTPAEARDVAAIFRAFAEVLQELPPDTEAGFLDAQGDLRLAPDIGRKLRTARNVRDVLRQIRDAEREQ